MTRYLDVSVVQIQQWLAQAPTLKGRRGASSMIRTASDPAQIATLLTRHPGIETNRERGPIDGVVSMTATEGADATGARDAVVARLRTHLPTATLRVVHSSGPTYAQRVTESSVDWPAPVPEWPLGRPCAWCRVFPVTDDSGPEALCGDCLRRRAQAGSSHSRSMPPGPERDLLEQVGTERVVPNDFEELARLGLGPARDDTHIATVYADGNALGRFIENIAERDPALLSTLPDTIHSATWAAVVAGLAAIDTGTAELPVIAHLVGGDDILVSLPAHGVWDFVAAMSGAFVATVAAEHPSIPDPPTLSAGVVVHHRSFPFSNVVELAGQLLRTAKAAWPGHAMIAWQSVTHDGDQLGDRVAVPTGVLVERGAEFAALAALAHSQRQRLSWLLRREDATDADLGAHLDRLGLRALTRPFLAPRGVGLADALDMVRWWRR
ncbi:Cas10/Cmr2 second palm domain-containing protein [Nocardia asteroides]